MTDQYLSCFFFLIIFCCILKLRNLLLGNRRINITVPYPAKLVSQILLEVVNWKPVIELISLNYFEASLKQGTIKLYEP